MEFINFKNFRSTEQTYQRFLFKFMTVTRRLNLNYLLDCINTKIFKFQIFVFLRQHSVTYKFIYFAN